MEKKVLGIIILFLFLNCKKDEENRLNIIDDYYKNIKDSFIYIDYYEKFNYKIYNCKIMKTPILVFKNIENKIETSYEMHTSNTIVSRTVFNSKNKFKDERNNLIKKKILKEVEPFNDDSLNGLLFIFSSNDKYAIVKEFEFSEVEYKIRDLYYKKYGVTNNGFIILNKIYFDSIKIKTFRHFLSNPSYVKYSK